MTKRLVCGTYKLTLRTLSFDTSIQKYRSVVINVLKKDNNLNLRYQELPNDQVGFLRLS